MAQALRKTWHILPAAIRFRLARCLRKVGLIPKNSWQDFRETEKKYELIRPVLAAHSVRSVLDVGCNRGKITRHAGNDGYFAVGIDRAVSVRGLRDPIKNACLGEIALTHEVIEALPVFDAILLLSVHHQWISHKSNDIAMELTAALAERAGRVFIIEFSAYNRRYGAEPGTLFTDNDETSVRQYAEDWLRETLPDWGYEYLGKAPERNEEPFRYMYACARATQGA